MKRDDILTCLAEFTWDFGNKFFVETELGNFVWSDPSYQGDNSFTQTAMSFDEWINGSFGRSKGHHLVERYCGDQIKIVLLSGEIL